MNLGLFFHPQRLCQGGDLLELASLVIFIAVICQAEIVFIVLAPSRDLSQPPFFPLALEVSSNLLYIARFELCHA